MQEHKPYQEWIAADEDLTRDQSAALQAHLLRCDDCRLLTEGYRLAMETLQAAPSAAPRAGFPQRWKALAEQRSRTPGLRQVWAFLGATGAAALLLAGGLLAQSPAANISLPDAVGGSLRETFASFASLTDTAYALNTIGQTIARSIPAPLWIGALVGMGLLCLAWVYLLYRIVTRSGK